MKYLTFPLLIFAFSVCLLAQNKSVKEGTPESFNITPVHINASVNNIFLDDMNGDNSVTGLEARGWVVLNEDGGGTTDPFYQGASSVFTAYEGPDTGYVASNYNGANGYLIDQWLISPEITVSAGDSLKFWFRSPDANPYDDSIYVRYSTTAGITPADFDMNWGRFLVSETGWAQWTGTFSTSGTVRFAIQYYITDGGPYGNYSNYIGLDYFEVTGSGGASLSFIENFDYPAGDSLINHGWVNHSGSGYQIVVQSGSLVYSGYPNSGIGNSVVIQGGSGSREDVHADFSALASGSIYAAFLVNVSAAATTGDYFFHLSPVFPSTYFKPRLYVKDDGAGNLQFGITKATAASIVYTTNLYSYNTTYLLVLKYEMFAGDSNDVGSLYINPPLDAEPTNPDLITSDLVPDDPIGAVCMRQGGQAYTIQIDGIGLGTVWNQVLPVELSSFTANVINNNVQLNWTTQSEVNNSGFEVQRKTFNGNWEKISFVKGSGTSTTSHDYSFTDCNLNSGKFVYRLKQIDFDGTSKYSKEIEVSVTSPATYELSQNFPNPFNPTTIIRFAIPKGSVVSLKVYNILGQEVATLINSFKEAGNYNVNFNASKLTSGIYFYKLEAGNFTQIRKMMLLK